MTEPASPGITRRIADFSVNLRYEDLPAKVVTEAKNGILDTLGVALAGFAEPSTRMLFNATVAPDGGGDTTIWGAAATTTPTTAALINAYAAHVLDYDDTQHNVGTHMSAPAVAAALAVAETRHCSGRDLITAYVAGFEVGCTLGRVGGFANHLLKRGFVGTSVLGVIGAATAAGRIAGLDAAQMRHCLGLAVGHASGVIRSFGSMAKAQNVGNAAQNGVLSALLAKQGFTGPDDIFDGENSAFGVYGAQTSADELFRDLGTQFEITHNTRKIFACAGWRNPIIEATMLLADTHHLKAADIAKIKVQACMEVKHLPNYPQPASGLQSKFSAQYAAAVAMLDHAGGVTQFSDARVADPALMDLARRVTLEYDGSLGAFQTRVTLDTHDGRTLSHFIPVQKGKHSNPMTWGELVTKFSANAQLVLPKHNVDKLAALTGTLESVADAGELARLCRSGVC
jgi:2-methylcitrate dehydratase PrpD